MVDTKITDLTSATCAVGDEFVINDVTDTSDKKVTAGSIVDTITGDITVNSSGVSALAANSVDSSELVNGSVDNAHLAGSIAASKLIGTDIDTVGTITTGVWTGTAIASANLDADTMHLSVAQTISAAKTFEDNHLKIQNPAATFAYTITGAAIVADRTLNLPLTTGTDTLMTLGLDQTVTGTLTLTTPILGTPTSGTLTNCTGLPITGITSSTSAEIATLCSDETGSGALVFATSPTLVTPALGTPASGVCTNLTGTSGITGLGTQTQDLEMGGQNIQNGGVIFLAEQADADADAAGEGQIWVDTATPNVLFFTDDAGTDFNISGGVVIGTQEIWIGAEAMVSTTTNGAEFASRELPTNDVMISAMKFDTTTSESAQFTWTPPLNWDAGTVKFKLYWTNAAGLTTETVDFDLAGGAYSDSLAIDTAFGTAQNVTDTWLAQNDMHISAQSNAITLANGPVAGEPVIFKLSRDTASDDLTGDAEVIGIQLEYSITAGTTT